MANHQDAQNHDYEEGLRDGRLQALERMLEYHSDRLDDHDVRFKVLERIVYGVLGAILLIQLLPLIKDIIR